VSLHCQILGGPGRDNALHVTVDSGQSLDRLLFDCGQGVLRRFLVSEIRAIDHVFFSHFHMDHVAGFDSFFRCTFDNAAKVNCLWGPPQTIELMHHRFRGFLWNLHEHRSAAWEVREIHPAEVRAARFELAEAFAQAHDISTSPYDKIVLDADHFQVEAITLDHRTPCLAYLIREKPRLNVDASRMAALGWKPGPWVGQLKTATDPSAVIVVAGTPHTAGELAKILIVESPGESAAYLTDFLLDEAASQTLGTRLRGVGTLFCESQYRAADHGLATANHHMTSTQAATLALGAGARRLVLFHLSERYDRQTWLEMLDEAKRIFPETCFPEDWPL
jgi:ribonuclease Z